MREWVCACLHVSGLLNLFRPHMGFPLKFRASLTVKLWEPASGDQRAFLFSASTMTCSTSYRRTLMWFITIFFMTQGEFVYIISKWIFYLAVEFYYALCKCLLSVTGHFSKGVLSPHPAVWGPRMPPSGNQSMSALNNRKIHLTIVKYMLICKYINSSHFIPCM